MSGRSFVIQHKVYFNETNAVGGVVYFSNYVKWQGMAREKFFVDTCPDWVQIMQRVMDRKLNMITVEEHSFFTHHAVFGDDLVIELQTANLRKFSFDMLFLVKNREGQVLYEGVQKLAFDNFNGRYVEIPESMRHSIESHLISSLSDYKKLKQHHAIVEMAGESQNGSGLNAVS